MDPLSALASGGLSASSSASSTGMLNSAFNPVLGGVGGSDAPVGLDGQTLLIAAALIAVALYMAR